MLTILFTKIHRRQGEKKKATDTLIGWITALLDHQPFLSTAISRGNFFTPRTLPSNCLSKSVRQSSSESGDMGPYRRSAFAEDQASHQIEPEHIPKFCLTDLVLHTLVDGKGKDKKSPKAWMKAYLTRTWALGTIGSEDPAADLMAHSRCMQKLSGQPRPMATVLHPRH